MIGDVTYNTNNLLYTKTSTVYYTVKSIIVRIYTIIESFTSKFDVFDYYFSFVVILFMGPNAPPKDILKFL